MESFSHEHQDLFAQIVNPNGRTYLDVACGHPQIGSNSYILERLGWQGWPVDLRNCTELGWYDYRTQEWHRFDVTTEEFGQWCRTNLNGEVIDYASIDVDANGTNYSLKALWNILSSDVTIRSMTFEHEHYLHGPGYRDHSRKLLQERGLHLMFGDVRLPNQTKGFEDWWVDPALLPNPNFSMNNLTYTEALAWLKDQFQISEKHRCHCSEAYPRDYDIFWDEANKRRIEALL